MHTAIRFLFSTRKARFLFAIAICTLALSQIVQAAPPGQPKREKFSPLALTSVVTSARGDQGGIQDRKTPSKLECRAAGDPAANINLDCDGITPNNEPQIAVDPIDPQHMVASS